MLLPVLLLLHAAAAAEWEPPMPALPPIPGQAYEYVEMVVQPPNEVTAAIGDMIAGEFDRHVPALSNNLRAELSLMRNDMRHQFESLRSHMDNKLDGMQSDAPAMDEEEKDEPQVSRLGKVSAAHTSSASIRHNLAMAELRRLGADLTRAMNREVSNLRDEFRAALDTLRTQVGNATNDLSEQLQGEFSEKAEESTNMLKKVFFLTRNQMALIQTQLTNISKSLSGTAPREATPTTAPIEALSTNAPTEAAATIKLRSNAPSSTTAEVYTTKVYTTIVTNTTAEVNATDAPTTEAPSLPRDCLEAQQQGSSKSGPTTILFHESPKRVWCDQTTDGGGWTVMLKRQKQETQLDFQRSWDPYVEGFGDPEGEYWIGLEALHQLTKDAPYSLRVDMTWEEETATSLYNWFSVGPRLYAQNRGYELYVGGYNKSSTGGDSLEYHNGMDFSTYDEDNDGAAGGSCSEWSGSGGWWFNYCYYSNPTGIYPPADLPPGTEVDHLLEWRKWQGYYTYLSSLTMMIRPNA